MPQLILFAGANGSGKSSVAGEWLAQHPMPFLNADEVAKQLCPEAMESVKISAGKQVLRDAQTQLAQKASFAMESTLSGKTHLKLLQQAKVAGYHTVIVYVFLESPLLCVERVRQRVLDGGHFVPTEDIVRRYHRSLPLFWDVYRPSAGEWFLLSNEKSQIQIVATGDASTEIHLNEELLQQFHNAKGRVSNG